MTLAAAPGRFQYGWVRGAASAAFVVGAVSAGQVVEATSLGAIVWMNGTMLALAAVAALLLPQNALDRPVVRRQANVRALFAVPGFLPLIALAALVLGSHALHDGFEVLRWQEGALGRARRGYCGQRGYWRRLSFSWWRVQRYSGRMLASWRAALRLAWLRLKLAVVAVRRIRLDDDTISISSSAGDSVDGISPAHPRTNYGISALAQPSECRPGRVRQSNTGGANPAAVSRFCAQPGRRP
jgi:hypothetical protein